MRKFNKLMALILTIALCLSMAITASADEAPAFPEQIAHADAYITKALEVAAGSTAEAMIFNFDFTLDTENSIGLHEGENLVPTVDPITTPAVTTAATENQIVRAEGKVNMPAYTHAGVYVYSVEETDESLTGVTYAEEEYTMKVGVVNSGDKLVVREIVVEKNDAAGGKVTTGTTTVTDTESGESSSTVNGNGFVFNNTYLKTIGNGMDAVLTISNAVKGAYADKSLPFSYKVTITKNSLDKTNVVDAIIAGETVHLTYGTNGQVTHEFDLKHGQTFAIYQMPAGATYTVEQISAHKGYTKSVDKTKESGVIMEDGVTVAYLNEYKDVTPTGIAMNNAPFMLMIGAAGLFLLLMLVSKKRREEA